MFPDPSTSPACYATTLDIGCPRVVPAEDAETGSWIRGFSRVVHLGVGNQVYPGDWSGVSLIPFHGLSPAVKSLRVYSFDLPPPRILDLALSFPLLEDLTVDSFFGTWSSDGNYSDGQSDVWPSKSSAFTGLLKLSQGGVRRTARQLVSLPGGIHFRKLSLTQFHDADLPSVTGLLEGCSRTLESLDVDCGLGGTFVWYSRPYRWLTSVSSLARISFPQPLWRVETQGCDLSAQFAERRVDHRGTPNHHTRISRPSTNRNSRASQLDRLRCQYQTIGWGTNFWAVVGP